MFRIFFLIAAAIFLNSVYAEQAESISLVDLRLNELQYIGTHNSYHIAPKREVATLLEKYRYGEGKKWDAKALNKALAFSHVPIDIQLELGIRTFEFDVHDDPQGGLYAKPNILKLYDQEELHYSLSNDFTRDMKVLGFKVFHMADFDYQSTCRRFVHCLIQIKQWSVENPKHIPIIIQIEPKSGQKDAVANAYKPVVSPKFDSETFTRFEGEILSVFNQEELITPNTVRQGYSSIQKALKVQGWPTLKHLLGKVMFVLIHPDDATKEYVEGDPLLKNRLMFANLWQDDPSSSFVIYTDPTKKQHFKALKEAQGKNLLTYTRADANSIEAVNSDYSRQISAIKSGANIISTDFPFPEHSISSYQFRFSNGGYVQCNVVVAESKCKKLKIH